jgi:hypothetical protein
VALVADAGAPVVLRRSETGVLCVGLLGGSVSGPCQSMRRTEECAERNDMRREWSSEWLRRRNAAAPAWFTIDCCASVGSYGTSCSSACHPLMIVFITTGVTNAAPPPPPPPLSEPGLPDCGGGELEEVP